MIPRSAISIASIVSAIPRAIGCICTTGASWFVTENGRPVRVIGVATDISERKAAEARQALLMREVDHRARNALSVVQSLVRLTRAANQQEFARAVEGRVAALARAHTLLADNQWRGADLRMIVEGELADFRGDASIVVRGPAVSLRAEAIQPLAMVVHELATNAAKHGALSTLDGQLDISWEHNAESGLQLRWDESGGPTILCAPEITGFRLGSGSDDRAQPACR